MAISVQLPKTSMFAATPVYSDADGTLIFGMRAQVFFPADDDVSVLIDQTTEGRLDLVAYDYLGDANLWWVVAELNNIVDPATGPTAGTRLRVPSKTRVQEKLQ